MEGSKIINSLILTAEKDDSSESLGILNMDNVKAYGESTNEASLLSTNEITDKLKIMRQKALKTFELYDIASQRDQTKYITKTNNDSTKIDKTSNNLKTPKTPGFDRTDYVSYNSYKTLNITDLQAENTINLESPGKLHSSVSVPHKISFEPSEITGRSTLCRADLAKKAKELTVEEVLASSNSGNVRNLRHSLHYNSTIGNDSLTSLPNTADMSKTSGTSSLMRSQRGSTKEFSFPNARRADESGFIGESFVAAELMTGKLDADECDWAHEYQAIPNKGDSSFSSVLSNFDQNNVSQISEFFRKRSENLINIVGSTESQQHHVPAALINDTISSTVDNFRLTDGANKMKTPGSNDKTYKIEHKNAKGGQSNQQENESYILSLSSIANALKQMNSDDSGTNVMKQLLQAKRTKSGLNPNTKHLMSNNSIANKKSYSLNPKQILSTYQDQDREYARNKENFDPHNYNEREISTQLCDTATFTESLLDTTDFRKVIQNETHNISHNDENQQFITNSESSQNKNLQPKSTQLNEFYKNNHQPTLSKQHLAPPVIKIRKSKSPSNSNELYAIAGASSANDTQRNNTKENRKRSRSASNCNIKGNVKSDMVYSEKNLRKLQSSKNLINSVTKISSISPNSNRSSLISYPNSPIASINHDLFNTHSEPKVSNPTLTINVLKELQREKNLKKAQLSTRINDEESELRSISPNFSGTRTDFRSPSPSSEKSKYRNSPISSLYDSPRSMTSQKYHNSPNSPNTLESTTNSDRRYLTAGGNHLTPNSLSLSPECLGKMSLPNYGLVTHQPSNLLLKPSSLRCSSQCSTSSEFNHHNAKMLPIKVTCMQFSWGSVKLRTNSKKSMQIKNYSNKRLVLKVEICGPGFQLVNLENCGNLITLQSQECRSIVVNFCPTVLGIAVGVLSFLPPQETLTISHQIPLYGYGGHTVVMPQGIQKGPIGLPFLTMGELQELSSPLVRTFTIYNKGPLNAFVVISLTSLGSDISNLCDCIDIEPKKTLIQPDDIVKFRVIFKPRRDDLRRIIKKISGVMTLATLRIISGDEPTRQRIRNIIRRLNDTEKSKITSATLDNCWKKFEQEVFLNELDDFNEKKDVGLELISTLRTHEIAITLNHTVMDDTSTTSNLIFPDADETIMFQTIVSNSMIFKDNESENLNIDLDNQVRSNELWSVRPNKLEIDPFDKRTKTSFTINNLCNKIIQDFEISSNYKHLFTITPCSGSLLPNKSIEINIIFQQLSFLPREQINIMIYTQNEKLIIPVNIKKDNLPPNLR